MSETNPINENDLPEGADDAINADPNQPEQRDTKQELQGGGSGEEIEERVKREVEENVEGEIGDRLQSRGEDRL